MANEDLHHPASMAPCVAMMALRRNRGADRKQRSKLRTQTEGTAEDVMKAIATAISMATSARLTPPSFSTSPKEIASRAARCRLQPEFS